MAMQSPNALETFVKDVSLCAHLHLCPSHARNADLAVTGQ